MKQKTSHCKLSHSEASWRKELLYPQVIRAIFSHDNWHTGRRELHKKKQSQGDEACFRSIKEPDMLDTKEVSIK